MESKLILFNVCHKFSVKSSQKILFLLVGMQFFLIDIKISGYCNFMIQTHRKLHKGSRLAIQKDTSKNTTLFLPSTIKQIFFEKH
jgi:hypothetical protein